MLEPFDNGSAAVYFGVKPNCTLAFYVSITTEVRPTYTRRELGHPHWTGTEIHAPGDPRHLNLCRRLQRHDLD